MFEEKLREMIQIEGFLDGLNEKQVTNFVTKEYFTRAEQEINSFAPEERQCMGIGIHELNQYAREQQNPFQNSTQGRSFPRRQSLSKNLMSMICENRQNDDLLEMKQIENRIKILVPGLEKEKLNVPSAPKSMFESIQEQYRKQNFEIRSSVLKVSDFMDIYEDIGDQPLADPIIKKIITYFQTSTKEYSLHELMQLLTEYLSEQSNFADKNGAFGSNDENRKDNKLDQQTWETIDRICRVYCTLGNLMAQENDIEDF